MFSSIIFTLFCGVIVLSFVLVNEVYRRKYSLGQNDIISRLSNLSKGYSGSHYRFLKQLKREQQLSTLQSLIKTGKQLEYKGELEEALAKYNEAYTYGLQSDVLLLSDYLFSIQRMVIILDHLQRKKELKIFLKTLIQKHPHCELSNDWTSRLLEIEK